MAEQMLKFTVLPQIMPAKRQAAVRATDFNEIYADFVPQAAVSQASRCSQCGIPFCAVGCPLSNNIPDWLKFTAEGRLEEAYELASLTNTFPEICGRICPQDRLCEASCVIEPGFNAVTIGAIERYVTDTAFAEGWVKPILPAVERPQSIGIVGAGPAGLAAAAMLRGFGYQVVVYDRYDRAGGLLIYGIPGFKLDKAIVERRWQWLLASKVAFRLGVDIGGVLPFSNLRAAHEAVLIATGVYKKRDHAMPGAGLNGIVQALDYLIASNRKTLGDVVPAYESGQLNAAGKNVVVIGGGDTAMDCVRTAIRQRANSVTCLYRRDRKNMPGSLREVKNAEEEGVSFNWLAAPVAFLGEGRVSAVRAVRVQLGPADGSGRHSVEPVADSYFSLKAELVIKALGFEAEDLPVMFNEPHLAVTKSGTLNVNPKNFETALPGVFAAGDIVRGASLVVWAIREGRMAARAIHQRFQNAEKPA